MGRTFKSVRMGSQEVAQRWLKASRALSKDDQIYGQRIADMIKMGSSLFRVGNFGIAIIGHNHANACHESCQ
jgi:hypothetical protein